MISPILKRYCGIDVHKKFITATLIKEEEDSKVIKITREFSTFKQDIIKAKAWLIKEGFESVCMESTAVLWFHIYDLLSPDLKVIVANPKQVKNIPNRKTDKIDSEWLAELVRFGLVKNSFIAGK